MTTSQRLKLAICSLEATLSGAPFVDVQDPGSLSPAGAQKGTVEVNSEGQAGNQVAPAKQTRAS